MRRAENSWWLLPFAFCLQKDWNVLVLLFLFIKQFYIYLLWLKVSSTMLFSLLLTCYGCSAHMLAAYGAPQLCPNAGWASLSRAHFTVDPKCWSVKLYRCVFCLAYTVFLSNKFHCSAFYFDFWSIYHRKQRIPWHCQAEGAFGNFTLEWTFAQIIHTKDITWNSKKSFISVSIDIVLEVSFSKFTTYWLKSWLFPHYFFSSKS